MFALRETDLAGRILGCGDGPASFNAEAARRGVKVVSCDPLFAWKGPRILDRIRATYDQILRQTRQNRQQFVWDRIPSVEELGRIRMAAMKLFLEDFDIGAQKGRYVAAELPALPFRDKSFEMALCSHLLFLYTDQLTEAFHTAAILEMHRVASEVRVFPLLALDGRPSAHVPAVISRLRDAGREVTIETVPYEFQRGGNQMLRIFSPSAR